MKLVLLSCVLVCSASPDAGDLSCLKSEQAPPAGSSLFYEHLRAQAYAALDQRQEKYAALKTHDDVRVYQAELRSFFLEQLGGLPERSPLNAKIVGTLTGNGHRLEKVIFESQPGHHVTANLYLPLTPPPYPGVVVSSGHSRTAKTAAYNQRFGLMLARHGMAALCFDPIGQGERSQILTPDGQPVFASTTQEHSLMGVGSILLGTNTARYRIWDAMRAVDFLVSRPDINAARLGMTGCSGGGTLTSYVMALDDRIACAAPACYITTFRKLIETIGPQDAEQNIHGQLARGLDHPDYLLLRAPRPTLISATTGDYFDIRGSWETAREAKRVFSRFGYPERVDLVEAEGTHGVQPANLAAITQWLQRWLLGRDVPVTVPEAELVVRPESELLCTAHGQVLRLPGERSVFDLNAEWEASLAAKRQVFWKETPRSEALDLVRSVAGVRPLAQFTPPRWDKAGKVQREGYHIDKLVLRTDSGVPLPALTYHPAEPQEDAYLYLHDGGKAADGAPGGPIEKLVQAGFVVVSVDLRGQGETGLPVRDTLLGDSKSFFLSYLLGKSLVGQRTEDALAAGHFVAYYQTKKPRNVHLVGVGQAGIIALHAAALEPTLFTSVQVRETPTSWSELVANPRPAGQLTSAVHGALRHYDLPDLVRCIGAEKLRTSDAP